MATFVYPPFDEEPWPTLGPYVCEFIERNLCHGPGDLLGQSVQLDDETRAWIYRMYEVHPPYVELRSKKVKSRKKNPKAGRRRFQRCALSLRKGSNKTEIAAWIAACELHPDGPVRCAGFDGSKPVPCSVTDPYIPMISYTEEQTEELAYGALRRILEESPIVGDFDIGLQRIMRISGDGKAEAVSASPNARDGARTTFEHADETHRFVLDNLKRAWSVMLANLAKRPLADPWAFETTTAPEPGAGSVGEHTMDHAKELSKNGKGESGLFFFHRQASGHDLSEDEGLKAAIEEASGPYRLEWTDVDRIAAQFRVPDADLAYLERVWTNRPVQASAKAFDVLKWKALATDAEIPDGAVVTLGFDGSRYKDSTAIVVTHVDTGFQKLIGLWERPPTIENWEVPVNEVDGIISDAFSRWNVWRLYADPPMWESWIAKWAGEYGKTVVVEWWTNRRKPMAYAIRSFQNAITAGELSHDGDPRLESHIGNALKSHTNLTDEQGKSLWILRKERPDSPHKIDAVMAAILSWEARNDALTAGMAGADELGVMFV